MGDNVAEGGWRQQRRGSSSGGSRPPKVNSMRSDSGVCTVQCTVSRPSTGDISQWRWDFGDGQTSSQRNPSHTYTKGGCTGETDVTGPGDGHKEAAGLY